jgi:hypothetical protein
MIIKKGLMLKEIAGNYVVVAVGSATKTLKGVITLNKTGAFLWELLEKGAEFDFLVSSLVSNFKVDKATATCDVEEFIARLKSADLLA